MPECLRGLSEDAIKALRPLDIEVGAEKRSTTYYGKHNGYRQKVQMIRFSFSSLAPKEKIKILSSASMRKKARKALRYLRHCKESEFQRFYDMRKDYMHRHPGADERQRRRPAHFIEEPCLECALWPHLYWKSNMCESYARINDVRTSFRLTKKASTVSGDRSSDESDAMEAAEEEDTKMEKMTGRHSMKQSFMTKVHAPLIGYGQDFELQQFVYDLNLWSSLGSKKNNKYEVPLRIMMKNHPCAPLYWKDVHNGLIDLVRQIMLISWEPSSSAGSAAQAKKKMQPNE